MHTIRANKNVKRDPVITCKLINQIPMVMGYSAPSKVVYFRQTSVMGARVWIETDSQYVTIDEKKLDDRM